MTTPRKPRSAGARTSSKLPVVLPSRAKPDEKRRAIIAAIKATGIPPRQAALSVGVSSASYYRLREDPTFVAEIESATALFGRRMGMVIARAAAAMGSWRAAAFWMERRWPESYGPKLDLHVDERADEEDRVMEKYPTPEALDAALADLQRHALANLPSAELEEALAVEIERRKERERRQATT